MRGNEIAPAQTGLAFESPITAEAIDAKRREVNQLVADLSGIKVDSPRALENAQAVGLQVKAIVRDWQKLVDEPKERVNKIHNELMAVRKVVDPLIQLCKLIKGRMNDYSNACEENRLKEEQLRSQREKDARERAARELEEKGGELLAGATENPEEPLNARLLSEANDLNVSAAVEGETAPSPSAVSRVNRLPMGTVSTHASFSVEVTDPLALLEHLLPGIIKGEIPRDILARELFGKRNLTAWVKSQAGKQKPSATLSIPGLSINDGLDTRFTLPRKDAGHSGESEVA